MQEITDFCLCLCPIWKCVFPAQELAMVCLCGYIQVPQHCWIPSAVWLPESEGGKEWREEMTAQ